MVQVQDSNQSSRGLKTLRVPSTRSPGVHAGHLGGFHMPGQPSHLPQFPCPEPAHAEEWCEMHTESIIWVMEQQINPTYPQQTT